MENSEAERAHRAFERALEEVERIWGKEAPAPPDPNEQCFSVTLSTAEMTYLLVMDYSGTIAELARAIASHANRVEWQQQYQAIEEGENDSGRLSDSSGRKQPE